MAKDKEEKDDKGGEEESLTIVTKDPADLDVPATSDEGLAGEGDEQEAGEEEQEEARLGASEETEEEEPAKRTAHKSRRARQKEAQLRLERERDFLERRNEQLERENADLKSNTEERLGNVERSQLDNRIAYARGIIKKAEDVISAATTHNKGDELVEATKIRDEWKDHLEELEGARKDMDEKPEEERKPPPANPRVVQHAKTWYEDHKWYDFQGGDRDSKIVGIIDKEIADEGYDPTTKEYWSELSKRVDEALPHRKSKKKGGGKKPNGHDDEDEEEGEDQRLEAADEDEEDEKPKPKVRTAGKGGPKFRTGGPGRDLRDNEVYLSRDRIAALKELGAWDDPKLRAKYLKKYREWDDAHPEANS
jgi:hypothetical protein